MPKPDDKIGPYTLIGKLGRGAFGVVWLAEKRTAITTTKVALKFPNDEDIDLEAVRHEASLWVQASGHPNVLPIVDADIYDDQVVIVSEYAPDGSLAKWLAAYGGKAPTIEAAIEMTLGILAGLEHLHMRSIIHRDLKPDNILLQGETPRLADFGIARILKTTSKSTVATGTPAYMPPEAFDGKRSVQTDIWSAGVIFYQSLVGRLPFPQTDMPSLLAAIITREPEPLPDLIPPQIRKVVTEALQRNPAQRYPSAGEMRKALRDAGWSQVNTRNQEQKTDESPFATAPTLTHERKRAKDDAIVFDDSAAASPTVPFAPSYEPVVPIPASQSSLSLTHRLRRSSRLSWILGGIAALLVISAIAFALYAGRYQRELTATANTDTTPTPMATPVSPQAEFYKRRREVDNDPAGSASRMQKETNAKPLDSTDPEFLYLYGRSLLFLNRHEEASMAFRLALEKMKDLPVRDLLKLETKIAAAVAAVRTNNPQAMQAASRELDEVMDTGPALPFNPLPTPPPASEMSDVAFEEYLREVDRAPSAMVASIDNEFNGRPLESSNAQLLYLYGRALLLSNRHEEASRAFRLALYKLKDSPSRDTLKVETKMAAAVAAVRTNNPQATQAASKDFDEVLDAINKTISPAQSNISGPTGVSNVGDATPSPQQ